MADTKLSNEDKAKQEQAERQRSGLNDAYAAIVGQSAVQSFSAFTFEEAADALIENIEGKDSQVHPNQLNRVEAVRANLEKIVEQVRTIDPSEFRLPEQKEDVNTSEK